MDNHLLRPEIVEAAKFSVGTTKRFSETINEDFMYYAQKVTINNNYIFLRVSVPLNKIKSVIKQLDESEINGFKKILFEMIEVDNKKIFQHLNE